MNYDHYEDPSVELAINLINNYAAAVRETSGDDGPPPDPDEFFRHHDLDPTGLRDDAVPAMQQLADRIHEVFTAYDDADAVTVVNGVLTDIGALPQISRHDGEDWHLHYLPANASPVDRLAVTAAMGLATVLCTAGVRRLGRCDGEGCRDVYVDTSRNNRRRFCSDSCANRTHVAAHRTRRRSQDT